MLNSYLPHKRVHATGRLGLTGLHALTGALRARRRLVVRSHYLLLYSPALRLAPVSRGVGLSSAYVRVASQA